MANSQSDAGKQAAKGDNFRPAEITCAIKEKMRRSHAQLIDMNDDRRSLRYAAMNESAFHIRKTSPWVLWPIGFAAFYFFVNNTTFNPIERFYETPPSVYRNLSEVLQLTGAPELRREIRQALDRDGKLTQANMDPVWRAWEKALPTGFTIGGQGADARTIERQRLIAQVGAAPTNTVWTPLTD